MHEGELRIEGLAPGGDGIARIEGSSRVVFVPRTAPGDVVQASWAPSGGALKGRLIRVVSPGPDRVSPPCPHAVSCGGCDWMFLSEAAQRTGHIRIVAEALRRHGGFTDLPEIVGHHAKDSALHYRARARLFVVVKRGRVGVGFRAAESHDLVSVDRCLVLAPPIDALFREVPDLFVGARGEGEVELALGANKRGVISVAWSGDLAQTTWMKLERGVRDGHWAGASVTLDGATAPLVFGDPRPIVEGADGRPLVIAGGGFAQPSDAGGVLLAERVRALVTQDRSPEKGAFRRIVELYCGSGTLSVVLAPLAEAFSAVESHAAAAEACRENLAARGLSGKVSVGDAGAAKLPDRPDVLVLDPPRTGAFAAMAAIAKVRPGIVVYVACDPVTLGRDLAVLRAAGYRPTHVETIELFPQTSHVETVVRLRRKST